MELSEFGMRYLPHLSLKRQVFVDFITEWLNPIDCFDWKMMECWILYVDGASRGVGARIRLILQSPIGECLEQAVQLGFHASNNEAKYEALLLVRVSLTLSIQANHLDIQSDSQLVVSQM